MSDVSCVRCGKLLPVAHADIVGNGYRCAPCTTLAASLGEDAEVADNVSPEERERLAKQGKRRFIATMSGSGAALAGPAAIGFAVGGPIGAAVGGLLGMYFASSLASTAVEINWAQWRRYRQPPLPKAKLRK